MLERMQLMSVWEVFGLFLLANVGIFLCSVTLCWVLGRWFSRKRLFMRWEPLAKGEIAVALGAIFLNSAISVLGWYIWMNEGITLVQGGGWQALWECGLMILAMDFAMYWFHRWAHHPWIYRLMHSFHHRHEATNPISLFVLHPVEVLGFGGMMIVFLMLCPVSFTGLMAYLVINILWGTLGHSGVEPFPAWMNQYRLLQWIGTSTFHAEHHEHPQYNFGFYTLLWDRAFGTLDPEYDTRFRTAAQGEG